LHLLISDEPESNSIELSPHTTAELNEKGELIGVEILNATAFLRDSILESVQFKMMQTPMTDKDPFLSKSVVLTQSVVLTL